jgi:hypothetical protein
MLCDTRKGVVYGTRLSEGGFAIANPYLSQILRLLSGTPAKREWVSGQCPEKLYTEKKEPKKTLNGSFDPL